MRSRVVLWVEDVQYIQYNLLHCHQKEQPLNVEDCMWHDVKYSVAYSREGSRGAGGIYGAMLPGILLQI